MTRFCAGVKLTVLRSEESPTIPVTRTPFSWLRLTVAPLTEAGSSVSLNVMLIAGRAWIFTALSGMEVLATIGGTMSATEMPRLAVPWFPLASSAVHTRVIPA